MTMTKTHVEFAAKEVSLAGEQPNAAAISASLQCSLLMFVARQTDLLEQIAKDTAEVKLNTQQLLEIKQAQFRR